MPDLRLQSDYQPAGDQPEAIAELISGLNEGKKAQTLLGVTGSGKTFTVANVLAGVNRPALVVSQNKTLAAQLYSELKGFFPDNRVEYFVSYFDYYQPESYMPQTDTYIAKDSSVNDEIQKYRLAATCSLLERHDVIVVASVSCIYGLGAPVDIEDMIIHMEVGGELERDDLLQQLVGIHYNRNDIAPTRSEFSAIGDVVDIYLPYRDEFLRVEFWGDEIESLAIRQPLTNTLIEELDSVRIYPATHYVTSPQKTERIVSDVTAEMKQRVKEFEDEGKLVEAQRIYERVTYDMEMLRELGYCSGIENYSRYLTGRPPGEKPYTLLDFFPEDFVLIVDESHVTLPQFRGMYAADRSRKETLVNHGFRLPSALDNRPMNFTEFESSVNQSIYISATPAEYELEHGEVTQLLARPTGLLDPEVEVRPIDNQVDDLLEEVRRRTLKNERVIVTCLTKKTSEDLCEYMKELGIKVSYLHSGVDTIERIETLKSLRSGEIDVIIGINLLREGMDLPEVALVAILDADKEGFLRSTTALVQTAGRAARNINGRVILYAGRITKSMQALIDITEERRSHQIQYNKDNNITPRSVKRSLDLSLDLYAVKDKPTKDTELMVAEESDSYGNLEDLILAIDKEMREAADSLEFERAAMLRDRLQELRKQKK